MGHSKTVGHYRFTFPHIFLLNDFSLPGKYKPSNIIFCPKCTNRGRGGVEVGVKIEKKSLVCLNLKPGLKKAEVETIRQILQGRNVIGGMSADEKKSYIAQRIVKRKLSSS